MKPTDEQKREFWELCGFEYLPKGSHDKFHQLDAIRYPDGTVHSVTPSIDLNSLFQYAVPQLKREYPVTTAEEYHNWKSVLHDWVVGLTGDYERDTISLFNLLYPILKEAKK